MLIHEVVTFSCLVSNVRYRNHILFYKWQSIRMAWGSVLPEDWGPFCWSKCLKSLYRVKGCVHAGLRSVRCHITELLFILLLMLTFFYMLLMCSQCCTITLKEDLIKDADEQSLYFLGCGPHKGARFVECDFPFLPLHLSVRDKCIQLPGRHLSGACAILRCNSVMWSDDQNHRPSILWTIYMNMLL